MTEEERNGRTAKRKRACYVLFSEIFLVVGGR